jgi:hypothetical protein
VSNGCCQGGFDVVVIISKKNIRKHCGHSFLMREFFYFCKLQVALWSHGYMRHLVINMMGELIGELTGNVTGQRLTRHHGGKLRIERTFEEKGKILGTEVSFIATTRSKERLQGGMFTKGDGIMMTRNGEKVTLHGSGITVRGKGAGQSIRGVRYAQTTAPSLIRLNDMALVFEIEITPDGVMLDKMWEWK